MEWIILFFAGSFAAIVVLWVLLGLRYVPTDRVGIIERRWSMRGSLEDGRIIALDGEAGFQAELLRSGLHWGYSPFICAVHLHPLVTVGEGSIGYVYARDGVALEPGQALARRVVCNDYQDARAFLGGGGQRGRQRAILREGVYAVNPAQFVVLTADRVYCGPVAERERVEMQRWHQELAANDGFRPVVVGGGKDTLGVVTVHDGPPLASGEVIAPEVADNPGCFQDPDRFLALGGRRGKQLQVLTDGTYFLNRWFASVDMQPKTVIPIGYVGVVVSYTGARGDDLSGAEFRYGEQVETGHRGVWKRALPPGKYALNPYAIKVELVPTVNFVLRWVTGQVEAHAYDQDLKSLELITVDGFEPTLPVSLVLHIDYEDAPRVVQRFGDVKRLITQTLDPILSAWFRDAAQSCQMLDLLTRREQLQQKATDELGRRFRDFDITCVAVMIGRPQSRPDGSGSDPIEHLFEQLRQRRLAEEQVATFREQEEAAVQYRSLSKARAEADKQAELAGAAMDVEITVCRGDARIAEAERAARSAVAVAQGQAEARRLEGAGEADALAAIGKAEAAVTAAKSEAMGDPRFVALERVAAALAGSQQPLVPDTVVSMGGEGVSPLLALMKGLLGKAEA